MPDNFTPEQISQILEEFFRVVGTRQYIGARYVPIFGRKDEDSIEWDNTAPYEPLTIVLYQGNSYTSRQYVPVGVEITNQEFWAITGNYNAQVEQYRRETAAAREVADNALTAANNAQTDIDTLLPKADFSAENTVKDYIDTSVAIVQSDIDTLLPKTAFSAENTVKDYIDANIDANIANYRTVSAMTENDLLGIGSICKTSGYHSENDNGGAYYIVVETATANDMDIIELDNGLFAKMLAPSHHVTPEMFGAYGNNTANDAPFIQRAIDFAYENDIIVLLSAKEYLIQSAIRVEHSVHVEGVDSAHTVIWCDGCDGFAMNGAADNWIQGVIIKHLQLRQKTFTSFVYPDFSVASRNGIYLQCVNSLIEDVICKGFNIGFYLYSNVTDIAVYHRLNYEGENHCLNLCNALFCNTGFSIQTYDMFATNLVAGMCHIGIQDRSAKLANCHVWGWFQNGYIFEGAAEHLIIECTNLELEACVASASTQTWTSSPVLVRGSVLINGFCYWNMGTAQPIFYITNDYVHLQVNGLYVGDYGDIDSTLTNSTVMPTIVALDSPRQYCFAYIAGSILRTYLTGRFTLNNSATSKVVSNVYSVNPDCAAYHIIVPTAVASKVALT